MIGTPRQAYHDSDPPTPPVLPALRELLSKDPRLVDYSAEALGRLLWVLGYLPQQPADHEVEEALEALCVEGEVLA
jgi:hypothetical protein